MISAVRSGWAKLALSTLLMCVGLVASEFFLRRGPEPESVVVTPTASNCLRRSAALGMEFVPNCAATWRSRSLSGDAPTSFTTNALGLRDDDLADDGSKRILALGDSCTWGWQVAQEAAYPQQLQRLIDARNGQGRYRVINAGVPGYTSYQGLVYLEAAIQTLRPSVVIIGFGFNDASRAAEITAALERQRALLPFIRINDFLLEHSHLWRWLRDQFVPAAQEAVAALSVGEALATSDASPEVRVSPAQFGRNLARMVRLCQEHAAKVILLSFASRGRTSQPYVSAMNRVATEFAVPLLTYQGPRLDVVHPTASGYRSLAEHVLKTMERSGYLSAPSRE